MPMKLLDIDAFRAGAKAGAAPEGTLFKFATTEPELQGGEDSRVVRFVFSDATIDHAGDSIDPKGWDTAIFKRNPVALFAHNSWEPPIGRASNVTVTNAQLVGDIEFAAADVYDFADTIYRLVKGKYLNAVSVGFKPNEWAFTNDKDRPYGIDFKKQTLLEISVCPVPCNPNALGEARSLGIDTAPLTEWAEKVLDSGDVVFLPRKDVEALRTQAKGSAPAQYYISGDREVSAKGLDRMRESYKRWREDPNEILLLEPGCTIRALGADPAPAPSGEDDQSERAELDTAAGDEVLDAAIAEALKAPTAEGLQLVVRLARKAGRRISAANKARLQDALDHHEASAKCIKAVMDSDAPEDDSTDDPVAPGGDGLLTEALVPEIPDDRSPEERRVAEAAAIKASLEPND